MKVDKIILKAYYDLDGDYIEFPDNPLHGKVYENADVKFEDVTRKICGINFTMDVIKIKGEEPIECEIVDSYYSGNTLVIELCQDWG